MIPKTCNKCGHPISFVCGYCEGQRALNFQSALSAKDARIAELEKALDQITEIPIRGGDPSADIDLMVEIAKEAIAPRRDG